MTRNAEVERRRLEAVRLECRHSGKLMQVTSLIQELSYKDMLALSSRVASCLGDPGISELGMAAALIKAAEQFHREGGTDV